MDIGLILGFAIYGIIWFLTLFAVLPFGVVSQEESGEVVPGTEHSAPVRPRMARKFLITTVLAAVFYALVYWLLTSGVLADGNIPFLPDFTDRS